MGDRMAVMKAGVLQQLGTPSECYDTPENIFVAQFVGSPPMNLVLAKVVESPTGLGLQIAGEVAVAAGLRGRRAARPARTYAGKDVAVGVRSEDMEDAHAARRHRPTAACRAR